MESESSWKLLNGSAVGTSHERLGESCQDYAHATVIYADTSPNLVIACADGAGSASHARLGAKVACLSFVRLAAESLRGGLPVEEVSVSQMHEWHARVRGQLSLEAALLNQDVRDFACTLLTAIVGEEGAAFSQIGDGAIVYREGGDFKTVFWPQSGEYANTTFFLTGEDFDERLAFRSFAQCIDELALFTDGLQALALHYASRSVHAPFFEPWFEALHRTDDTKALEEHLELFLNSKLVNDRTDDDKTLVLATRWLPRHDAP
jgi:hypothetical protein